MKRGSTPIRSGSTFILKSVILLFGLLVLGLCIFVLPAGIRSDEVGAYRLILIGMYIPAIPFFIGLFKGFRLLRYIDNNKIFSQASADALRTIKYCAFLVCGLYAMGMPYIFHVAEMDDAPGVAVLGFVFVFASLVVGTAAAVFQKVLQNVIDMKKENELTV